MGIFKRLVRFCGRHRVIVTGSITFSVGLLSPDNWESGVGNNKYNELMRKRRKSLQSTLANLTDKIEYFLHVEVDGCRGLAKSELMGGESDPFVVVKLNGVEFGRTKVVDNQENPNFFNEAFEIPIPKSIVEGGKTPVVTFHVWDWDVDGAGDFLGEAVFNVTDNDLELEAADTEENIMLSTMTLRLMDPLSKKVPLQPPSFNVSETTEMHRSKEAARLVPRAISRSHSEAEKLIEEATQDVESSSGVLYTCFFFIVIYFVVTWVFVTHVLNEEMTMGSDTDEKEIIIIPGTLDAIYFAVVTFSTVGYGDFKPGTKNGKIFSIFHTFSGVALIGSGFTILLNTLMKRELARVEKLQQQEETDAENSIMDNAGESERKSKRHLLSTEGTNDDTLHAEEKRIAVEKEKLDNEDRGDKRRANVSLLIMWLVCVFLLCLGGGVVGYYESNSSLNAGELGPDWDWIDSIYWVMATATSVGYGDIAPMTQEGRAICIFFIPLAVGLMGASIGQTVQYVMERRAMEQSSAMFKQDFALDDFIHMTKKDTDSVTREEFALFMLLMMKKCDKPLLNRLNRQFDRMDKDGDGTLDWKDLELMNIQQAANRRNQVIIFHKDHSNWNSFSSKYRNPGRTSDWDRDEGRKQMNAQTRATQRKSVRSPTGAAEGALISNRGAGWGKEEDEVVDIEMGNAMGNMSPPHKDHEEGLYFFDASTPEQAKMRKGSR